MDRYLNLETIRARLRNEASKILLAKDDFEATEFELVEQAQDKVDEAVALLTKAMAA